MHSECVKDKRAKAIKLIQKRWKTPNGVSSGHKCRRTSNANDVGDATTGRDDNEDGSNHPTLLYRRSNIDYSSTQQYSQLQFLNDSTLLAVNTAGQFDIVGIHGRNNDEGGKKGSGRLLAGKIKLSIDSDQGINVGNAPLNVYGFHNGSKFAVGLPSGDVEIISTERASSGGVMSQYPPMNALWSCLPTVAKQYIGPRRRYERNTDYSLQYMLSLDDQENLLQEINNHSTFEELDSWDEESLRVGRSNNPDTFDKGAQWAFREGSMGTSSALIGACIDQEMDCFSIRIMDSRERQTGSRPMVFVDASCPSLNGSRDNLASTCFSGEFGLVTAHNFVDICNPEKCSSYKVLRFHDLRMLWKRPVQSMNLSFPRDMMFGTSAIQEMKLQVDLTIPSIDLDYERCSRYTTVLSNLTGPDDSSDRIVVTLDDRNNAYENWIIQPSEQHVVQRIVTNTSWGDKAFVPYCFSRYLDCMAFYGDKLLPEVGAKHGVTIYDISQHQTIPKEIPKKRQVPAPHNNPDGYLGRLEPNFFDEYGLESGVSCFCMDEFGSALAFGTNDGDIFYALA